MGMLSNKQKYISLHFTLYTLHNKHHINSRKGFTLIELMIAISIAGLITAATFYSLDAALSSWGYSRDNLALQKVISEVMKEVTSGPPGAYGIKDGLEVITAGSNRIEFVPPWTDDSHTVAARDFIYKLNRKVKPGTGVPIGEVKLHTSRSFQIIPVKIVEMEDSNTSKIKLGISVPKGSDLHFTYRPDPERSDVIKRIWWDSTAQQVYSEDVRGVRNISRNPFGVKIVDMQFLYYDNNNTLISDGGWVDSWDLNMITGVEIYITAQLGRNKTQRLMNFVTLRNTPMLSGYLSLRQGSRIPIPDSTKINTLSLDNISGVSSGDELEIELTPDVGKSWRINIKFEQISLAKSVIESYTIEYPTAHPIHTEYPRSKVESGLDLLTVGPNGLYDYDDDNDVEDIVRLEGDVMLKIVKMDVEGAGLFIRP